MKIYISGLYSGTNPQPGIGIARSLRTAYPDATLVGVEYSNRCSGIHWQDFDEIWLQRPWEELNLTTHAAEIKRVLDEGGLWISSIDLEIMWFASLFPEDHPNLPTPPLAAMNQVAKPAITASTGLPVKIPTFVTTEISDWDLHAFCREHDWKVWLKGSYYDAVRTGSWAFFQDMRNALSNSWSTEKLFLQTHVSGYEESISLSAYQGELFDCVRMRKRDLTEMSKTWAGDVSEVEEEMLVPLREMFRRINWTGGAELEMVRDADNQLWLLEVNPRYPAWIHGATITGRNILAALIEGATGVPAQESVAAGEEFTRVVLEIPVRSDYPLSPLPEPLGGRIGHSLKHPSGLVQFANRLHKLDFDNAQNGANPVENQTATVPQTFIEDLDKLDFSEMQTPASLFLKTTAADYFAKAAALSAELSTDEITISNAYSFKTNPDERLIKLTRESGFFAEAISLLEAKKALAAGFKPEQIILNGPAKWWRRETLPDASFYTIFCDSIEELNRVIEEVESGASSFPIHWCEAVRRKTLDCGALAALAAEVFTARGVKTYRVQMVQRFSEVSTLQWSNSWNDSTEPLCWMNDDLIYHEGCAIAGDADEIKIWDASAGWWADPKSKDGYGALLALRLSGSNLSADANFIWGEYVLDACRWSKVNLPTIKKCAADKFIGGALFSQEFSRIVGGLIFFLVYSITVFEMTA